MCAYLFVRPSPGIEFAFSKSDIYHSLGAHASRRAYDAAKEISKNWFFFLPPSDFMIYSCVRWTNHGPALPPRWDGTLCISAFFNTLYFLILFFFFSYVRRLRFRRVFILFSCINIFISFRLGDPEVECAFLRPARFLLLG